MGSIWMLSDIYVHAYIYIYIRIDRGIGKQYINKCICVLDNMTYMCVYIFIHICIYIYICRHDI